MSSRDKTKKRRKKIFSFTGTSTQSENQIWKRKKKITYEIDPFQSF